LLLFLRVRLGFWYFNFFWLFMARGWRSIFLDNERLHFLLSLFVDVAEDIVEDKITCGLLGKDEGLHKLLEFCGLVRRLSNDLDDDVFIGGLRVDIGDADLAVLEVEILDTLLDGL
jgi:hypothetical protein